MRGYFGLDNMKESEKYFQLANETLQNHWGPSHPLHITIYGLMAQILISKPKFEDAMFLYKSSLLCCNKVLGHSHIQTANTHMDFGVLYLIWDKRDLALQEFETAYYEYEHYFNNKLKL